MDGYGTTSNWWPNYQQMPAYSRQKSSSVSNEALTESGKKADEPTNWIQKFSIFAIVFVILASIAVAIAVPILISKGPQPDNVDIFFDIRILTDFSQVNDSTSTAYKAFVITLCQLLIPVLNGPGQIGANYITDSCQVLNLTSGSVIARVTSSYHIIDTRHTSINDVENNIFSTFVQRVDNGTFGLPVDKTAFAISGHSQSMTGEDPCDPSLKSCDQICTSAGSSIQCSCFNGYQLNGFTCEGVDICGLGLDKCDHTTTYCMNGEYQTFTCPCLAGYKPGPPPPTAATGQGQQPQTPTSCVDINECVEMPWVCNANTSTCNNTIGGYVCNCLAGFEPSLEPFMANDCIDINECADQEDHCDYTTTTCVNTPGNYTCACRPGFDTYANYYCSNTNECTSLMPCNLNTSVCQDTFGSFMCNCIQPNFTQSFDGSCNDVDECALERDTCNVYNQTCLNNFGGFTCPCKVGFNLTSSGDCMDIDECMATPSPCPNMNCSNTVGSYYCYCTEGFNLTTDSTNATSCQDINECATNSGGCSVTDSYCWNTIGSFNCTCKFTSTVSSATDPDDGCTIGESGFFIKLTTASPGVGSISYDTAVDNFGLLSGNSPFTSISTNYALGGNYWVHQTLRANTPTTVTPTWGSNTFTVDLSSAADDMTSVGNLIASSTTSSLSTVITGGNPIGDGTYYTSLLAFSIAAIAGGSMTSPVTNFFPQTFSVTVPTAPSGSSTVPMFVSLTTAANSTNAHIVQLVSSSQVIIQNRFDPVNSLSDTITSAAIVMLPSGSASLSLQLVSGSTSCSATNSCSFSWFSYVPNDARFTTVYWSVYRSSPLLASTQTTIGFDIASVVGQTGLWDAQNNAIVVPVKGVYYININAATQPSKGLDVRIFVNGMDVAIGLLSNQNFNGVISKSRGAIVVLNLGDKVTVVAKAGSGLYGDTNWPSSSFTGFLLYAHQ